MNHQNEIDKLQKEIERYKKRESVVLRLLETRIIKALIGSKSQSDLIKRFGSIARQLVGGAKAIKAEWQPIIDDLKEHFPEIGQAQAPKPKSK